MNNSAGTTTSNRAELEAMAMAMGRGNGTVKDHSNTDLGQ
jgi:hypothetical protein